MSIERPCIHWEDGYCKKFSDGEVTSWCVDGPCEYEKPSNADRIRAMSDEELYAWAKKQIGCGFDFFPCGIVCDGKCESYSDEDCKAKIMNWLQQPAKENNNEV